MKKTVFFISLFFYTTAAFSYQLPDYITKDLKVKLQKNDTYDVYYVASEKPVFLYHTQPADLQMIDFNPSCNAIHAPPFRSANFLYKDFKKHPQEMVFISKKTSEPSSVYPYIAYKCPNNYNIIANVNYSNAPQFVVIQPIFKSQPKVWVIIPRNFKNIFPGNAFESDQNSHFLSNGDLYLALSVEMDPGTDDRGMKYATFHSETIETIPIDYSLFEKPVKKPTCYFMLENHKLRLCTAKEAKLRSPALSVFLGEATSAEAFQMHKKAEAEHNKDRKRSMEWMLDNAKQAQSKPQEDTKKPTAVTATKTSDQKIKDPCDDSDKEDDLSPAFEFNCL